MLPATTWIHLKKVLLREKSQKKVLCSIGFHVAEKPRIGDGVDTGDRFQAAGRKRMEEGSFHTAQVRVGGGTAPQGYKSCFLG